MQGGAGGEEAEEIYILATLIKYIKSVRTQSKGGLKQP